MLAATLRSRAFPFQGSVAEAPPVADEARRRRLAKRVPKLSAACGG